MAYILEKDIEGRLVREVKRLGGMALKFVSPGRAGVPDRLVLLHGRAVFVELKAPGKKPRPLQVRIFELFAGQGFPVRVVSSPEQVDEFVREMMQNDI